MKDLFDGFSKSLKIVPNRLEMSFNTRKIERESTLYTGPKPPSPILFEEEKLFVAVMIMVKS